MTNVGNDIGEQGVRNSRAPRFITYWPCETRHYTLSASFLGGVPRFITLDHSFPINQHEILKS